MRAVSWAKRRMFEGSTYAGMSLIFLSQLNIQTNNDAVNQGIQIFNAVAPVVGGLLAGASTKHS